MPKSVPTSSGWTRLKNRQTHRERFLSQYGVDQYILDFCCPRLKLAIEIDSDSHFVIGAEEYDKERQEYIETFGIQFLPASPAGGHFTNEDVYTNIDRVCQTFMIRLKK